MEWATNISGLVSINEITQTYYVLAINYKEPDGAREWSLKFKSRPSQEVIFSGDTPTRDEIIQCLAHTNAPIWMTEVIEVVIADAIAKTAPNT